MLSENRKRRAVGQNDASDPETDISIWVLGFVSLFFGVRGKYEITEVDRAYHHGCWNG